MFSIFVLFSREEQFAIAEPCLADCIGIKDCQLILVCDEILPANPYPHWQIITLKRKDPKHFCWYDAFTAGIDACEKDKILYLDCDRILPTNYLIEASKRLRRGKFIFSEKLFRFKNTVSLDVVKQVRDRVFGWEEEVDDDLRLSHPPEFEDTGILLGKGPFSGNTAFYKSTYRECGGFDPRYLDYGFIDTDLYYTCWKSGYRFETVPGMELHLKHDYRNSVGLETIWNAWQFAKKHNVEFGDRLKAKMEKFHIEESHLRKASSLKEFLKDRKLF
jgi:hypothetical protein